MQTQNVVERLVGVRPNSALAQALAERSEIMSLTQASHDAVIIPHMSGGLSHSERAALAERIARLSGSDDLAKHYRSCLQSAGGNELLMDVADAKQLTFGTDRIKAIVKFTDLVTQRPRDATKQDIQALKDAGISEADIVRLTEVLAFVNYQLRVVAGLKLAGEMQ